MPDYVFTFNPNAPQGERLSPEVREEIEFLAPSTLNDNAVSTVKIQDDAVTNAKIAPDAVHSEQILNGEVISSKLGPGSVTTPKIAAGAVTPTQAGQGIVTSTDTGGAPLTMSVIPISATDYAALVTPSPSVLYVVPED